MFMCTSLTGELKITSFMSVQLRSHLYYDDDSVVQHRAKQIFIVDGLCSVVLVNVAFDLFYRQRTRQFTCVSRCVLSQVPWPTCQELVKHL